MAIDPTPLLHNAEKNILELLHTELELAFTFLKIARDSESQPEKRGRNIENAKKAYATTAKWLERMNPEHAEREEIQGRLGDLRQALEEFGAET